MLVSGALVNLVDVAGVAALSLLSIPIDSMTYIVANVPSGEHARPTEDSVTVDAYHDGACIHAYSCERTLTSDSYRRLVTSACARLGSGEFCKRIGLSCVSSTGFSR